MIAAERVFGPRNVIIGEVDRVDDEAVIAGEVHHPFEVSGFFVMEFVGFAEQQLLHEIELVPDSAGSARRPGP